jgi:diguanylate cyclase (GGDEF)-like protein
MTRKKKYMVRFVENYDLLISRLLIPAWIFSYLMAINEYSKRETSVLFFINTFAGTLFLLLFLLGKRVKIETKLEIIIIMILAMGFDLIYSASFKSNGSILLTIGCMIAIVFLSNTFSRCIVILTIFLWYVMAVLVMLSIMPSISSGSFWLIQASTFMILMLVSYFSINLLKQHLFASIDQLEQNSEEMQRMMAELESKYNEIKQNEDIINKLAYYDQLTGLPNNHMLKKHITNRIEENVEQGKLVIIDVKNFKIFNSIYSNLVGDEILIGLSELIRDIEDPRMFAARITGNEYALWFESASENEILMTIRTLRERFFNQNYELMKHKKIDFYISYSNYPEHATDYNGLYQKAAIALSNARKSPDSEITRYNDRLYEIMMKEEYLKQLVEQAINKNEFIVYYQNKIDTNTGNVCGVEALSRWQSSELGFVTPDIFMPVIEKSNLTINFGENVIRNVLNNYEKLMTKFGQDLKISINVSPIHVITEGFEGFVINEIAKRNINPKTIVLEITEEVIIEGVDMINGILKPLKDFGVLISLDDFGSGYSSLNNLSRLAPDELKLDKTFIKQIEDKKVVSLLEAIIQLQGVYGYSVVAEGVETKQQLDTLTAMGCHIIQGYYFSKPMELK